VAFPTLRAELGVAKIATGRPDAPLTMVMPESARPKAAIDTIRLLLSATSSRDVSTASSVPIVSIVSIVSIAASTPFGATSRTRSISPGP